MAGVKDLLNMSTMFPLYPLISIPAVDVHSGSAKVDTTAASNWNPSHVTRD